jgi:hypothetical protein
MLGFVESVNPNYYPVPLQPPRETAPGFKIFDRAMQGFLSKEDFVTLYDTSAEWPHCRNPYAPGDPTTNVKYTVDVWSLRIKTLLIWHFVQLADVPELWIVQVANDGPVSAFPGLADGPFMVES